MHSYGFCIFILVLVVSTITNLQSAQGYGTSTSGGSRPQPPPNERYPEHPDDSDHGQWPGGHEGPQLQNQNRESGRYEQGTKNQMPQKNAFSRPTYSEKYGMPEGCTQAPRFQEACKYYVEITKERNDPEVLHFELAGHLENPELGGWIAVGLSNDTTMGKDHIVECVKGSDGRTASHESWSTGRIPTQRIQPNIRRIQMESTYPKYVDGVLICKFKRPLKTFVEFEGEIFPFDLIYGEHHVLLASGTLNNIDSDAIGYHRNERLAGPKPMGYVDPRFVSSGGHQQAFQLNIVFLSILFFMLF